MEIHERRQHRHAEKKRTADRFRRQRLQRGDGQPHLSLRGYRNDTGARAEVARGRDAGQQLHRHPCSCGRVASRREDAPEHHQHHGFQGGSDLQGPAGGGGAGAAVLQKGRSELPR